MTKKLYVASAVQKALLTEILIPEMATGFWKDHRPADHAAQWADCQIIVTHDEKLGPVDFEIPRLYNFVNPDFIKPNEQRLVDCAVKTKSSSNFRSVKKELIELSRIVGGRLTDKNGIPSKANRGTNKPSTVSETVKKAKETVKKAGTTAKKTAVKKGTTTTKKGNTTVKRVPIVKAEDGGVDAQELQAVAENITPTGEAMPQSIAMPEQEQHATAQTEGASDEEIAEAAKIVQEQAAEGDKVTETVTTITTTTVVHQEPAHEVTASSNDEDPAQKTV